MAGRRPGLTKQSTECSSIRAEATKAIGLKEELGILAELFAHGGLIVETPDPQAVASGGKPAPPLVRSLVQPDADVITRVSAEALGDSELIGDHFAKMQALSDLPNRFAKRLKYLQYSFLGALPVGLCLSGFEKHGWALAMVCSGTVMAALRKLLTKWLERLIEEKLLKVTGLQAG